MDYRRRRLEERISHQIVLALLTLLTVIVQVNLLPMVLRASLNLVLVAVVAWTMIRDANTGAAVAFYGGLALDLLAGTPIYHLIVMIFSGGASNWLVWAAVVLPPALVVNLILALPEYMVLQWWNERRRFRR